MVECMSLLIKEGVVAPSVIDSVGRSRTTVLLLLCSLPCLRSRDLQSCATAETMERLIGWVLRLGNWLWHGINGAQAICAGLFPAIAEVSLLKCFYCRQLGSSDAGPRVCWHALCETSWPSVRVHAAGFR